MKTRKENLVQAAVTAALELYCSRKGHPQLRQFPPFANQQGDRMRRYCADIVGMLDNADIILLEMKELDCEKNILPAFDSKQHESNVRFEKLGVPIAYAYNTQPELEYNKHPRSENWPNLTLGAVNRSPPSELPDQSPAISKHETLLDWLSNAQGGDATKLFGRIHGAIKAPSDLRNGVLMLLYGVNEETLATLSPDQVLEVLSCLNKSNLQSKDDAKLKSILGASAEVFKQFQAPPKKKRAP